MTQLFETERLSISQVVSPDSLAPTTVINILTARVTRFLPSDWQTVSDSNSAAVWLERRLKDGDIFSIIHKDTEQCIGFLFLYGISSKKNRRELRLGYLISERYWGKGIASEVIAGVVEFCRSKSDVETIIGGVSAENIGSIRVLTKNNFDLKSTEGRTAYYGYAF